MATRKDLEVLLGSKVIAVVGLSKDPSKESYTVSEYMKNHGYKIIPVNPTATEILEEKAYPSLLEIPSGEARTIEIIDIFRPSDQVPPIVDQAIQLRRTHKTNPKMVWLQLGIENAAAAEAAGDAGMVVVQNLCVRTEHRKMAYPRQSA